MSMIPTLAEVLSKQVGRAPAEVEQLIREALAEVNRQRWLKLTPEERESLEGEIDRARFVTEPTFPPEEIVRIPLSLLPFFVRRVREDLATARAASREAYDSYQELLRSRTLWYHENEKLQITAADKKARIDPRVQKASRLSLELQQGVEALERAESNLMMELEVRLVLVRSGVLPDPEAVRPL